MTRFLFRPFFPNPADDPFRIPSYNEARDRAESGEMLKDAADIAKDQMAATVGAFPERMAQDIFTALGTPVDMLFGAKPRYPMQGPLEDSRGTGPVLGSDWWNHYLGQAGGFFPYTYRDPEKYPWVTTSERAADGVSWALPTSRVMGAVGRGLGKTRIANWAPFKLSRLQSYASGIPRSVLLPYATNPTRAYAQDIALALGGGVGAGLFNKWFNNEDRSNPWIDLSGDAAGSVLTNPIAGLTKASAKWAFGPPGGSYGRDVKDHVAQVVAKFMNAPLQGQSYDTTALTEMLERSVLAAQNSDVARLIPGYKPTTASHHPTEAMRALELNVAMEDAGLARRINSNDAAVQEAIQAQAPPSSATPGAFSDMLRRKRDSQLASAQSATSGAEEAFRNIVQEITPTTTAGMRGDAIREALEAAKKKAHDEASGLWDDLDAPAITVPSSVFAESVDSVTNDLAMALRNLASPVIKTPGQLPPITPLKEINAVRSVLRDAERVAYNAGEEKKSWANSQYLKALDDTLSKVLAGTPYEEKLTAAQGAWADYKRRFEHSTVGTFLQRPNGRYAKEAADIPPTMYQPDRKGSTRAFQEVTNVTGKDPRVTQALTEHAYQDVVNRIRPDGSVLSNFPDVVEKKLNDYKTVFDWLPQARERLLELAGQGRTWREKVNAEASLRKLLESPDKSAIAKYLQYGDERALNAMNAVVESTNPAKAIDDLLNYVEDAPEAVQGARKVFFDLLKQRASKTRPGMGASEHLSPSEILRFLDAAPNAAVAKRLWRDDPEHLKNIRTIAEVFESFNSPKKLTPDILKAPSVLPPALQPANLDSKIYAMLSNRIGPRYTLTSITSAALRYLGKKKWEQQVYALMGEVLADPNKAAMLTRKHNPLEVEAFNWRGLNTKTWGPEAAWGAGREAYDYFNPPEKPQGLSFEEWLSEDLNSSPQTIPSQGLSFEEFMKQ